MESEDPFEAPVMVDPVKELVPKPETAAIRQARSKITRMIVKFECEAGMSAAGDCNNCLLGSKNAYCLLADAVTGIDIFL